MDGQKNPKIRNANMPKWEPGARALRLHLYWTCIITVHYQGKYMYNQYKLSRNPAKLIRNII
jgi:hypothetical protein